MRTISCKEAVEYILKKEEGELSFIQRIQLWRHLAICNLCKIFSIQNGMINRAMKERRSKYVPLSEEEKDNIVKNVLGKKES